LSEIVISRSVVEIYQCFERTVCLFSEDKLLYPEEENSG